jgi:hypothetical protein
MDKVQKPSNSVCYTPSSEPYRIYKYYVSGYYTGWWIMSRNIIFVLMYHRHRLLDIIYKMAFGTQLQYKFWLTNSLHVAWRNTECLFTAHSSKTPEQCLKCATQEVQRLAIAQPELQFTLKGDVGRHVIWRRGNFCRLCNLVPSS